MMKRLFGVLLMLAALVPLLSGCEKEESVPKYNSHAIEVGKPDNGTIAIRGAMEKAAEGYKVQFTAEPAECYVVEQVAVTRVSGGNVALETVGSDPETNAVIYTFVMPGEAVKVAGSFKLGTPGKMNYDKSNEFSVVLKKDGKYGAEVAPGSTVTLLDSIVIKPATDKAIVSVMANKTKVLPDKNGEYRYQVIGEVTLTVKTIQLHEYTLSFVEKFNTSVNVTPDSVTFDGEVVKSPWKVKAGAKTLHTIGVTAKNYMEFNDIVPFPETPGEVEIEVYKEIEVKFSLVDYHTNEVYQITSMKINGEAVAAPYRVKYGVGDSMVVEVTAKDYVDYKAKVVVDATGKLTIKLDRVINVAIKGDLFKAELHHPFGEPGKETAKVSPMDPKGTIAQRNDTIYIQGAKDVTVKSLKLNGVDMTFDGTWYKYVVKGDEPEQAIAIVMERSILVDVRGEASLFTITKGGNALTSGTEVNKDDEIVVKPAEGKKIVVKVNGAVVKPAEGKTEITYKVTGKEAKVSVVVTEANVIKVNYTADATLFTVTKAGSALSTGDVVKEGDEIVVTPADGKQITVKVNGAEVAEAAGAFTYKVKSDDTEVMIEVAEK